MRHITLNVGHHVFQVSDGVLRVYVHGNNELHLIPIPQYILDAFEGFSEEELFAAAQHLCTTFAQSNRNFELGTLDEAIQGLFTARKTQLANVLVAIAYRLISFAR